MVQVGCTINYDRSSLWKARKKSVVSQFHVELRLGRWTYMPNLSSLYIPNTLLRSALIVVCIVIGLTVRVALMAQPGTRFQSYWRLFFKKHPAQKN
jgi:urea transporter